MQSGAPTFGTPEPALVLYVMAALARRLGVPFRSGGNLCASKIADAQAAYESAATFGPTILAGVNFVLHAAGWLEGGLAVGYEKFILDADQCGMAAVFVKGVDLSRERPGARRDPRESRRASTSSGAPTRSPTSRSAFYRSETADNNSFEQWLEDGGLDAAQRANAIWKRMLDEYEAPPIDPGIDEALREFIAKRKASMPDSRGLGAVLFRRRQTLAPPAREALTRILAAPTFELVPLKNALDQAAFLPPRATVSVTASPAKGIEATVALCEQLQARGFRAVPHLSARMVRDRAHLADLIAWLEGAGVDRAFVVGGDAKEPGDFPDGLSLLREMARHRPPAERDRHPVLPAGPRVHRRRGCCSRRSATRRRSRAT